MHLPFTFCSLFGLYICSPLTIHSASCVHCALLLLLWYSLQMLYIHPAYTHRSLSIWYCFFPFHENKPVLSHLWTFISYYSQLIYLLASSVINGSFLETDKRKIVVEIISNSQDILTYEKSFVTITGTWMILFLWHAQQRGCYLVLTKTGVTDKGNFCGHSQALTLLKIPLDLENGNLIQRFFWLNLFSTQLVHCISPELTVL